MLGDSPPVAMQLKAMKAMAVEEKWLIDSWIPGGVELRPSRVSMTMVSKIPCLDGFEVCFPSFPDL